jgi:tetratricopeptide (TPR) repeat protein
MCFMKKIPVTLLFLCFIVDFHAFGTGGNQLSLSLAPACIVPFPAAFRYFTPGAEAGISVEYQLPVADFLGLRLDLNGSYLPLWTGDGCAFFSVGGGPCLILPRLGGFTNTLFGSAGFYYGIIADSGNKGGGNFFLSGGVRSGWQLTSSFNAGAEITYRYVSDGRGGALYQGLGCGVSARYSILQASQVQIEDIKLDNVFPVFLKYYDTHPMGSVVFRNNGTAPIKDMEVSFFVDKYMDNPTQCPAPRILNGGQKVTVDLFALFSEKVFSITESTVVSGKVKIAYTQGNKRQTVDRSASLPMHDRNAITWDDDRKVAAFVQYKDPAVLEIAKTLARIVKDSPPSVDVNLCTAMALHEALRLFGLGYVVDPTSSYAEQSKNKVAVDYIQFPRGTLQYKSGDCDDLSVLYASILQGVGIDTAFITVPGHIYMAFSLKAGPEQAAKLLPDASGLILRENRAWVPLEITMTGRDFMEAWNTGASEWRDNERQAGFIPVAQAWETYSPAGYFEDTRSVTFVPDAAIASGYRKELALFTDRQLGALKARLDATKPASLNTMAILCIRYGMNDKAKAYLAQALQKGDFFPALVNYGSVLSLEGDAKGALGYFLRAQKMKPNDAALALRLSQTYARLGNTAEAEASYSRLAALDPDLASRHSELSPSPSGQARAAERVSEGEATVWEE